MTGNTSKGYDSLSVRSSHREAFFCTLTNEQIRIMLDTTLEPGTRMNSVHFSAPAADELRLQDRRGPVAKTDGVSVEAVERALCATGYPAFRDIQIEIERGVVVLSGRVPTYHQKQVAQATAQRVEGVRGIANGIEVVCSR